MLPIKLIWFPNFYQEKIDDFYADFNTLFWEYIFSDAILSSGLIWKISEDEASDLKFILKNITLSYNIFQLYSKSAPEVYHLLFAFNIIDTYLQIINNHLEYETINFYSYARYDKNIYQNIEKTLTYTFFLHIRDIFERIPNESTIRISIELSEQIYQIKILQYFLKSLDKKVFFILDISGIREFENKISIKKLINDNIDNVVEIIMTYPTISIRKQAEFCSHVLGVKDFSCFVFNVGCTYRKCVFCNIWKWWLKLKNECDAIIEDLILLWKEGIFNALHIADPDIQPEEIVYISEKFIAHHLDIKIHIRTRFSKKYTPEVLMIMFNWWVRFMGIWLESWSKRINKLMNKYEEDIWTDDFDELIANCVKVGINIHLYTIFWFPTETKDEIDITKNYLLNNLSKYPFFTYTPWLFWLNKGTYMYNNPEKFNLSPIIQNSWEEIFLNFYEKNTTENHGYLKKTVNNLAKSMFLGDDPLITMNAFSFWNFIEHSSLFHTYKMYYTRNPFLEFFTKNDSISHQNYLYHKYFLIKYYSIFKKIDGIFIKNWINSIELPLDAQVITFLENYNQDLNLDANLQKFDSIDKSLLLKMIQNYFFIKRD